MPSQEFQVNSDDSSEEEGDVQTDMGGAARQAQFTVRLLLDFLPNDILENFRYVPSLLLAVYSDGYHGGVISLP